MRPPTPAKPRDLTSGPVLKTLVLFSLPTLASNLLQSLNGSVNSIWVGRLLGEAALAATANANIIMFLVMVFAIRHLAKVVTVPKNILFPIILMMCVVGAYTINYGVMFDVWTLLIFGLFGYLAHKIRLEIAPFIIGFILGPSAEIYFVKSLESFGTFSIFFTKSWIAVLLWILIALSIAFSISVARKKKRMTD